MATANLIPVEEYLRTSFEDGDREYVDGEVIERNLGEIEHSDLQTSASSYLRIRYKGLVWTGVEVRVQVKARRFRVPDVSVVLGQKPTGRILTEPPFIVIEVLSPEDRAKEMEIKVADYLEFGVAYVWVLNPELRTAAVYTGLESYQLSSGELRTANPEIILPLKELF